MPSNWQGLRGHAANDSTGWGRRPTRPRRPPEQLDRLLYAHPERQPLRLDPAVLAKQEALVARQRGPDRDAADLDLTSGVLHP